MHTYQDKTLSIFTETTSQQLFTHLYEACNILRGPVNQDEYKSYIIPILFFKRVSDVYDEETQTLLASTGDKDFASLPENHRFIIPQGCHWDDLRNVTSDIGKAIAAAMSEIERANPQKLRGIFSSFDDAKWTDKTKLTDERLKDLIEHMSKLKVGNKNYSSDVMGDSYEYLIKKFADLSKRNAGEFYTPREIVKLLILLLSPEKGETVYDPACGTGGMLIEAIHHIKNVTSTYGKIYGQENNLATSSIARMNLFLHGADDFYIAQGDTLRNPQFFDGGKLKTFDCVVANPPFALSKWGAETFSTDIYGRNLWGCPSESNGDFAWLQHMAASMTPVKGRCAVILPQGVLFRVGRDGEIRRNLVESGKLECIISLAGGVFYSTGVSACVIFLRNTKTESHQGRVCMIDASGIFTPQRAQNVMTEDDVRKVFALYENYNAVPELCSIVPFSEIREKNYSLAVNNYVAKEEQAAFTPDESRRNYYDAFSSAVSAENVMKELLTEGGYLHEN